MPNYKVRVQVFHDFTFTAADEKEAIAMGEKAIASELKEGQKFAVNTPRNLDKKPKVKGGEPKSGN